MHLHKRTDQILKRDELSDGICPPLTSSKTCLTSFFLILFWPYPFYFTFNYDDKFSRELVGGIKLSYEIYKRIYHGNKDMYLYLTYSELDSNNISKRNIVAWKIGYHDNNSEAWLPQQL